MRSDSVQSDHKSVQEEAEEETESSQEKKLPGYWNCSCNITDKTGTAPDFKYRDFKNLPWLMISKISLHIHKSETSVFIFL